MRRLVFLFAVVAAMLVLGGTALAATLACNGGRCVGSNGPDTMFGSTDRDEILSLKGGDLVRAGGGPDLVNGDGGDDELLGGQGNDTIKGGSGNDVVAGNQDNDRLIGGSGNDRIEAADGRRDIISCGPGPRDLVIFDAGLDRLDDCEVRQPR